MRTIDELYRESLRLMTSADDRPDLAVTQEEYIAIGKHLSQPYGVVVQYLPPKDRRMGMWFECCWVTCQEAP